MPARCRDRHVGAAADYCDNAGAPRQNEGAPETPAVGIEAISALANG